MATMRHRGIYQASKKFYFGMDELRARQNELMRPIPPTLIDEEWARHLTWKEAYTLQHILIIFESLTSQEDPTDGPEWVSLTYAEWHEEMPFLKQSQVKTSIQSLEKKGLIRSQDTHKRDSIYRWKSYAINLDEIRNISSQVTDIYVELIEPTNISMSYRGDKNTHPQVSEIEDGLNKPTDISNTYNGNSKELPQVLDFNVGLNKPTDISNTYEISSHNSLKSASVNPCPPWDNPYPPSVQKSPYIYDDLKEEDLREDLKTKDKEKDKYKDKEGEMNSDLQSDTPQFPQQELPLENEPKPKKKFKARHQWHYPSKRLIPDDFEVTPEMQKWFDENGFNFDIAIETRKFKNHADANDRKQVDWIASWKGWMDKATGYQPTNQNSKPATSPSIPCGAFDENAPCEHVTSTTEWINTRCAQDYPQTFMSCTIQPQERLHQFIHEYDRGTVELMYEFTLNGMGELFDTKWLYPNVVLTPKNLHQRLADAKAWHETRQANWRLRR